MRPVSPSFRDSEMLLPAMAVGSYLTGCGVSFPLPTGVEEKPKSYQIAPDSEPKSRETSRFLVSSGTAAQQTDSPVAISINAKASLFISFPPHSHCREFKTKISYVISCNEFRRIIPFHFQLKYIKSTDRT